MPGRHRYASLVLTMLILFSLIPFNVTVGQLAYDPWVARPLYINGRPLDPANPPSIILGETVRIEIAGVNNGNSDLDEGYLTLSFPDLTSTSSYVVISRWIGPAGNTVSLGPGSRAWAGYGRYQVTLQYWLVEGYAKPWRARQFYALIVEVKPERVGQFRVHAKMVGKAGNNWYADPTTRGEPKQPQPPGTVILDQQQQEYAYEFVINVLPPKGSLRINVHNIPGLNLPAASGAIKVDLYTSNRFIGYQYAYFSGGEPYVTVEFQNLDVGNYYMKVTQKPNVGLQILEFWGISSTEVRAGPPTLFEFYRHTQVITAVNPTKQQCGSLSVGQSITPTVRVKNYDNVGKETKVRLIIDRDRAAPYDYDIWSDTLTIPSGEERGFALPSFTFTATGQYYIYAIAYGRYMLEGIEYNPTDQYVWVESCLVGAPTMGVSPTTWSTTVLAGSTAGQTFTITVSGGTALGVTVSRISGPDWISISPASLGDIPPGQSRSFTVTVSPPSGTSGSFSYTIRVSSSNAGSRDIAGTITVSHIAASIVDFRPPTGMYEPGDRLTARVTVRNTGTVSTIFWIGLSYIKPDRSIFDVPPIQTQRLLPGEQQEVVFSWQLPLDAPVGNYSAVTAIWAGYDQQRNVMIPPKFDERRVDSAFRVERFDFKLIVTPSSVITAPGQSANYVITVERVSGRPRSVSLTISGLPQGVQHTFSQSSGEPTFTSTLNVVTSATTPQGSYTLTITASGGGVTRTASATLVIQAQQDTVAPTVRVIAPNGGETLTVGGTFRIRWEASDNVGVQRIHIFLFQGGSQVLVIARELQNTGYYDWTVPDRPGTNYRVRVVAVDAAGNAGYDDSDAPFSIVRQQQELSVDVWTDKGGQGRGNLAGGQYNVGDPVTLYCSLNINVDRMRLIVIRPDGGEVVVFDGARGAGTHSFPGTAGQPPGERRVICEAWKGDQHSSDEVKFIVAQQREPALTDVGISMAESSAPQQPPITVAPGSRFRAWYWVNNPNNQRITVVLGLSIRAPNGQVFHDPQNDVPCELAPQGNTMCSRFFTVPSNAPAGTYEVIYGLWTADRSRQITQVSRSGWLVVQQPTAAKVQIGITHTYVGDLRIWLGVQGGREVLIWNREGGSSDNIFREWDLFSLGFTENDLPPSSSKRWYLKVRDEASGDEGRIEYFRIVYQGQTYESQDRPEIKDFREAIAWIPSQQQQDNAEIIDFSPPRGVFERGSSLFASIKVKNTGMTTRSFWVGLSYRKPDGSYYDITPKQTNTLAPGQEQVLTFQWQLPEDAPTGEYDAITAVWNGYDPQRNIMIEPQYNRKEVPNAFEVVEESILFREDIYYRRLIPTGATSEVQLEPIGSVYLTGRRNLIVGNEYEYELRLFVRRGELTGREYFIYGLREKPGIIIFFIPEELDWRFDPTSDFIYPGIRWQRTILDWLIQYIGWAIRATITLIAGAFGGPKAALAAGFVMFIVGRIFQFQDQAYDVIIGSTITPDNQDPAKADAIIINWSEQGNTQGPILARLHVIPSEYARGKRFQISIAIDFWVGGGDRGDQNIIVRGNSEEITVREKTLA